MKPRHLEQNPDRLRATAAGELPRDALVEVSSASTEQRRTAETILVAVDFKEQSLKGLNYALWFAERSGALVVVLHVVEPTYGQGLLSTARKQTLDTENRLQALQQLEALVPEKLRERGLVKCVVRGGIPELEILRTAEAVGADLIVLGRQCRNPLQEILYGSTTRDLVDCAPCPVLVINPITRKVQCG